MAVPSTKTVKQFYFFISQKISFEKKSGNLIVQNCDQSKKLAKNNNKIKHNMFYFLVKTFSDKFLGGCNCCRYFTMHFSTNISIFIVAVKKSTSRKEQ